ncbi:MAG: protein kinase [Chloroflexota bacterium]|nr:protein kinase [Chloroflexota bacterium]
MRNGMIGRTIEHYRIDLMLGQGGMAAVYRATDLRLQRQVAIKIMHPHLAAHGTFQQRFLQEARASARLDHPNIIRVLTFNNISGDLFLVMELISGGSLRQYIKRLNEEARIIDYPEAIEVMRQLAEALDYAHQQGMIHRDIKPDNVLLKPESGAPRLSYRPILTDFGLAKLTASTASEITDQQPVGTYPYMSPEQCLAERVDQRSDIYSLGIMLYELSVGRLPFNPKSIAEAAKMHGREPVPLPSTLRSGYPTELEQIVLRCLNKDQALRYAAASDVARDLQALLRPILAQPMTVIMATPLPPAPTVFNSPDDRIPTDIATAIMSAPLPASLPQGYSIPMGESNQDRLVFYSIEQPAFSVNLAQPVVTIGRAPDSTIVLSGGKASRFHAEVERKPNGKYYLTDRHSTNGVWVDNTRLEPDVPILFNTTVIVRLGDYWMQLELKALITKPEPSPTVADTDPEPVVEAAAAPMAMTPVPSVPLAVTPVAVAPAAPLPVSSPMPLPPERAPSTSDNRPTDVSALLKWDEPPRFTPPQIAPDQMGYDRLILFSEDRPTLTFKLDGDRFEIGRSSQVEIVVDSPDISRVHALLERAIDGKYYIRDSRSRNGVWSDGVRLQPGVTMRLEPEKRIRIGEYWLQYELKRVIPISLMAAMPTLQGDQGVSDDANATVVMIKPLDEDMPPYSPPPLTIDLQSNDRLVFFSEDHPMKVIKLASELLTVGRGDDQDIQLDGKRVSRAHAQIELRPDGSILIMDRGSSNGTWVSDTLLVPQTHVLWDKDEIVRLGNYWVKFEGGNHIVDSLSISAEKDSRRLVGKRIKNFRIDRFLGQNVRASVYKATELPLDRVVALKIMHPNLAAEETYKQRFLQDSRVLSRLDHPNIVRILSYDNVDNELFMVMELVTGNSIRSYLDQLKAAKKQMSLSEAVALTIQIAEGLNYAHQQGLIHRALTPSNVVLRSTPVIGPIVNYVPVLTEFTVADSLDNGENYISDKSDLNYPYASPEQCLGERVDVRSDIYELGVLFYEMLVGNPPYQPRSISEAIRMHAREPIPLPRYTRGDIPEELEILVLKMLEKNPNNRFQSAIEVARALQRTDVGALLEGARGSASLLQIDEAITAVMSAPLAAEMPQPTRAPSAHPEHDLLILYGDNLPTRAVTLDRNVLTIGRGDGQDILLDDQRVSRQHVRIEVGLGGAYRVIDQGSKNGTYLGNYRLINGIAEMWNAVDTLRIGGYWVRIERANARPREETGASAPVAPAPEPVAAYPPLLPEKIQVNIDTPHLQVTPGTTVAMPIEVVNRGDVVDHFRVELIGLPPNWASAPSETLFLLPNTRNTTSVTFHPPMNSTSAAGEHAFEVRVSARAQGLVSPAVQGSLNIQPFYSFVIDMEPERIASGKHLQLSINNSANTFGKYTLQARDREQMLRFDLSTKQYTLAPGQNEIFSARVVAKRRHLLGAPKTYPFEIAVIPTPAEAYGGVQSAAGEVAVTSLIPGWLLGGCLLMIILIGAVLVFGYTQLTQSAAQSAAQTQTQVVLLAATDGAATATASAATATAIALDDLDGDGLSNARESTLETFPDLADTDEDGLSDGDEVRVWLTNPLNRDTDGDTLTDGEEVDLGTDPNNRDTDGDGVPDNEDIAPILPPTATITPFPTIFGSAGDICVGSPVPGRMIVGAPARVASGGLANRVRSDPSKADGQVVALMRPGTNFVVVGGPTCDSVDQLRWWQINYGGLVGWTAEGENGEYYLEPLPPTPAPGAAGNAFPNPGGS